MNLAELSALQIAIRSNYFFRSIFIANLILLHYLWASFLLN